MGETLRELVDQLPTQSLELFVQTYEGVGVGNYLAHSQLKWSRQFGGPCCPRAALGFPHRFGPPEKLLCGHPAYAIENLALRGRLDTAELYSEAILAIQERDATLTPEREREEALT